jgi:hypothetical protein
MSSERLSRASVLVGVRGLVIKRSSRKRMQHRVITPTLDNHQCGLGLLLRKLIDQFVESLLRGHLFMVSPTGDQIAASPSITGRGPHCFTFQG